MLFAIVSCFFTTFAESINHTMTLLAIVFWFIIGVNVLYWSYVLLRIIIESFKGRAGSSGYPSPLNKYLRGN